MEQISQDPTLLSPGMKHRAMLEAERRYKSAMQKNAMYCEQLKRIKQ
jgi:hypothetical protein